MNVSHYWCLTAVVLLNVGICHLCGMLLGAETVYSMYCDRKGYCKLLNNHSYITEGNHHGSKVNKRKLRKTELSSSNMTRKDLVRAE